MPVEFSVSEPPFREDDNVWSVEGLAKNNFGPGDGRDGHASRHEQRRCRGEYFFVADRAVMEQAEVARVYVACKMPESTAIAYYTAVPRTKGGAYVVTNAGGQGFALILQRQTETADGKLRGAILEALRRFDQEPEARGRPADGSEKTPER